MRVLVTWGSKLGGTAGIAQIIADTLAARGIDVVTLSAEWAPSPAGFDAVIIGGVLYANRWPPPVRRYVERNAGELSRVPTWLFSSGPLDDSADTKALPAPRWLRGLSARIGAIEHRTFGGRLGSIRAWAIDIADKLPAARPRPAMIPAGASRLRVVEYGVVAWAIAASMLALTLPVGGLWLAFACHLVAMPAAFAALAVRYHGADGARAPVVVALAWTSIALLLDLGVLAPLFAAQFAFATSSTGLWAPLLLAFLATWATGSIAAMLPVSEPRRLSAPGGYR